MVSSSNDGRTEPSWGWEVLQSKYFGEVPSGGVLFARGCLYWVLDPTKQYNLFYPTEIKNVEFGNNSTFLFSDTV